MGFNWQDNRQNTKRELAEEAAKRMYAPCTEKTAALIYVIEKLVMPHGQNWYTDKQMADWIEAALEDK
jgi:hypothetical protein